MQNSPQFDLSEVKKELAEYINKALITGNTAIVGGTSGAAVVRQDLQAVAKIIVPLDTPLRNRIVRFKGNGRAHSWARLTSLGTGGGSFAENGRPNTTDSVYVQASAPYKQVGNDLAVTDMMIAAGASFDDVLAEQRKIKIRKTMLDEENLLINGDSVNPLQFDGLLKQITTNVTNLAGVITLDALNDSMAAMYTAGGMPTSIVVGTREKNRINKSLFSLQRFDNNQNYAGVAVQKLTTDFGEVDLITSRFLAPVLGAASAIILDERSLLEDGENIQIRELIPLSYKTLGFNATAYEEIIYESMVLCVLAENFNAVINNIL